MPLMQANTHKIDIQYRQAHVHWSQTIVNPCVIAGTCQSLLFCSSLLVLCQFFGHQWQQMVVVFLWNCCPYRCKPGLEGDVPIPAQILRHLFLLSMLRSSWTMGCWASGYGQNLPFQYISFGSVCDEAGIRSHRRTTCIWSRIYHCVKPRVLILSFSTKLTSIV